MFKQFTISRYVNTDLNVTCYGRQACNNVHYWGPGIRDYYLIHYVISGKGIFQTKNKTYNIESGNAFLIEPNTLAYYAADKNDPWEYVWVGFNGINAKHYISQIYLSSACPVLTCKVNNELEKCIEDMLSYSHEQIGRDIILLSCLYKFIYHLTKSIDNPLSNLQTDIGEKYVKDAAMYISNNYSSNIKISDVAKYINITRAYLFRLFKKYLHTSPQEFLINFRMERACELLSNSNFTVNHIARSVGYRDVLLFSKIFKKIIGVAPTEYRKNHSYKKGKDTL